MPFVLVLAGAAMLSAGATTDMFAAQ